MKRKYSRTFDQIKYDDITNNISRYAKKTKYYIENDMLYFDGKKVIKLDESFDLINELHLSNGHDKSRPLFDQIEQQYYGITRTMVETYVKNCSSCKKLEKVIRKQPVQPIVSNYPRERVLIDLIDMKSFNKKFTDRIDEDQLYHFILTVIDHYSNFTFIYPQKTKEQGETARNIANYIRIFGSPKIIQSDNGSEFVNKVVRELLEHYKIKEIHSAAYHPQTNGKVERYNRFIKACLRGFMKVEKDVYWIEFVDRVICRINGNKCRRTNCKPRSLFFMDIEALMKEIKIIKTDDITENEIQKKVKEKDVAVDDDDDNDNNDYISVKDKHYYEDLDDDTIKEYNEYSDVIEMDIKTYLGRHDECQQYIKERVDKYNNKMVEDSKKNLHNKVVKPEHGDVVVITEKKKNYPDENKLGIVVENKNTEKKFVMYKYYILSLHRVDDDQIPINASTPLDIMPTSTLLKEQMQKKADLLYV